MRYLLSAATTTTYTTCTHYLLSNIGFDDFLGHTSFHNHLCSYFADVSISSKFQPYQQYNQSWHDFKCRSSPVFIYIYIGMFLHANHTTFLFFVAAILRTPFPSGKSLIKFTEQPESLRR